MRFLTIVFFFAFVAVSSALLPNLGLPVAQKLPIRLSGDLVRQVPIVGDIAEDLQVVAGVEDAAEEAVAQKLPIRLPGALVRQVPIVGDIADDLQLVAGEDDAAEEANNADEPAPEEEEQQDAPKESDDNNVGGDDNADDGAQKKPSRRHRLVRLPRFVGIPRLGNKRLLGPLSRHVRI